MNNIKKLSLLFTLIIMSTLCLVFNVSAEDQTTQRGISYEIYPESGVMIFSGEGEIKDDYFGFEKANGYYNDIEFDVGYEYPDSLLEFHEKLKVVKTLIIEEGITGIGDGVFNSEAFGFSMIETLITPESLEKIGSSSFAGCKKLTKVYLSSNLKKIGDYAFDKTGIKNIIIPESVVELGSAFNGCDSLKTITFTNATCPIYCCKKLTKIVYPKSISKVETLAVNCPNLKKVTFQNLLGTKKVKIVSTDMDAFFYNCPNAKVDYLDESIIESLDTEGVNYAVVTSNPTSLGEIKNLKYTQSGYHMTITWSAVKNAGYYQIFYYNGTKWEKIYSGRQTKFCTPNYGKFTYMKNGKYRVRAVSYDGKEHIYGKFANLTINIVKDTSITSAKKSGTSVTLIWKKVEGATGYLVYDNTGKRKKIANVKGTSYTIKNLEKGKKYVYRVKAYRKDKDGSIKYSCYSVAKSVRL